MAQSPAYRSSRNYAQDDRYDQDGYDLPLFNPHPPAGGPAASPIRTDITFPSPRQYTSHLTGGDRPPDHADQYNGNLDYSPQYQAAQPLPSPTSRGAQLPYPSPSHQRQGSMSSALPYSVQYSNPGREELLPPQPASAFSLGRSASLGTRKKDPYSYSSDDVESGLGNIDMREEPSWGGDQEYGQAPVQRGRLPPPQLQSQPQGYPQSPRDVVMSPVRPSPNRQMNPPPVPSHAMGFPTVQVHDGSGDSSPSRPSYSGHGKRDSFSNPYVPLPRGSDPGPNGAQGGPQWTDYRRTPAGSRMPSSGSFGPPSSPLPDQLSPYMKPETFPSSPHSPLMNPYDSSPGIVGSSKLPSSPLGALATWPNQGSTLPTSPPTVRQMSTPQYPASQPVTPASNRPYDMGPPRGLPSRTRSGGATSRSGFMEVQGKQDLRPVLSQQHQTRRADPNRPGKYLSPLKCLTAALPQTYALCNPSFRYETSDNPRRVLTKPSKPVHNDGADNEDWDYILYVNDVLGGDSGGDRYLILDVLGQGTFGQVVKCQNMRSHEIVAVKVVKNKPAYLNQSKMEVAILELLNTQWDSSDVHHILRMYEHFTHKSHLCLVFECLSSNLYELIKQNQFKGLSTQLVKVFTQQLLDCMAVLKNARLIHCDLKPENILLKSLQSPQVKVIDFGSACHEMATVYTYIQSRFYRSPEVLLGLPYSTSIDMWSLGCIIVELFLGLPLFPGTSEYNQVSRIVDMLGNPPGHLLEVGKQTETFFNYTGVDAFGKKQYVLKSMNQYASEHRTKEQPSKQYFKQTKLTDIIMEYPYQKKNAKQTDIDKEMAHRRAFVDFVEGLLNLDPIQRWSPQQAAKHPFITGEKFTGPFQPPSIPSSRRSSSQPTPVDTSSANQTTPTKKYGGLVQSPSSNRTQRIYSDAAAYNHQLAHHQAYTAQVAAANAARSQPFGTTYDVRPTLQTSPYASGRAVSSHMPVSSPQNQWQTPQNQSSSTFGQRIPSQGMPTSNSHSSLRANGPIVATQTNPPPNSYYPSSRNRANTINQMDAIPPALARLAHFGLPDPSGSRNLTPVLNRDDAAMREWERRRSGHTRQDSMVQSYPQLEYLQEQAELAAMNTDASNWMLPVYGNTPGGGHAHRPSHGGHSLSHSGSQAFPMQPAIALQSSPGGLDYRRAPNDYDPPASASSSRSFLPTFPPPAATSNPHTSFDGFDGREANMGMMYTPLQPSYGQSGFGSPQAPTHGMSHAQRASYSGPYHNGGNGNGQPPLNNPFAPTQSGQMQQQGGQNSPRYQRRSGGYGA